MRRHKTLAITNTKTPDIKARVNLWIIDRLKEESRQMLEERMRFGKNLAHCKIDLDMDETDSILPEEIPVSSCHLGILRRDRRVADYYKQSIP